MKKYLLIFALGAFAFSACSEKKSREDIENDFKNAQLSDEDTLFRVEQATAIQDDDTRPFMGSLDEQQRKDAEERKKAEEEARKEAAANAANAAATEHHMEAQPQGEETVIVSNTEEVIAPPPAQPEVKQESAQPENKPVQAVQDGNAQ